MAHVEVEVTAVVGEAALQSPRRPSLLTSVERALGLLVEIPAALLVIAEIIILFAGVVARYALHQPLIWSDELASILFLWLAMLGAAVAFRRADRFWLRACDVRLPGAHDRHALNGAGRPHGRRHEPFDPAVGAAVRVPGSLDRDDR